MSGFPSASKITDATVDAYVAGVEDVSVESVQRSCKQFSEGRVDGHNNAFMPTVAELASNARQWDEAIAYVTASQELRKLENLQVVKIGEQPKPPAVPLGPTKLNIGGFDRDLTGWSHEEKEEAITTGKVPKSVLDRETGGLGLPLRIQRVVDNGA